MGTPISNWSLDGIKNPLVLQSLMLDEFENSSEGKYTIADGNNVVTFLMEMFASLSSNIVRKIDDAVLPSIFPSRATEIADLYKHLSDYDYVGLFASPASANISLIMDKASVIHNAVPTNDDGTERMLIIPSTTRFSIGSKTYGLYYPIVIKVSTSSGLFTATYDTSVDNPLYRLTTNVLPCQFVQQGNSTIVYITVPVHQFDITKSEEPLVKGSGYHRTIDFKNRFYAIRCFADVKEVDDEGNATWVNKELKLSLYGRKYDPENPTVIFSVDPRNNFVTLDIPYVYFTNDQLRGNMKVELYTTEGYINYSAPTDTEELVGIDMFGVEMDPEVEKYASPFRTMTHLSAVPITMTIVGGTNGMSYKELRRRILYNSFTDKTLQTPMDIDAFFADRGYTTTIYQDGITDRVFLAHAVLRGSDTNEVISCGCIDTLIDIPTKNGDKLTLFSKAHSSSVLQSSDGKSYTIFPSARFRYLEEKGYCELLTDAEVERLYKLSPAERVEEFNANSYTFTPYHICVYPDDKYPRAVAFDMTDTDMVSREYIGSSGSIDGAAMSASLDSSTIFPQRIDQYLSASDDNDAKTTDAYLLKFAVSRSGLDGYMSNVLPVLVGIKTVNDTFIWFKAQDTGDTENYYLRLKATSIFKQVNGEYAIKINNKAYVYLDAEIRVILGVQISGSIKNRYIETIPTFTSDDTIIEKGFCALSEYKLIARLGNIVNQIDPRVRIAFSGKEYKRQQSTAFLVLDTPMYKLDAQKVPVIDTTDPANPKLVVEYPEETITGYTTFDSGFENVAIDAELHSNRIGCEFYIDENTNGVYGLNGDDVIDTETGTVVDSTMLKLKQRNLPRFVVSDATKLNGNKSGAMGSYELVDAKDHLGALSHYDDKWLMTAVKKADGSIVSAKNYRFNDETIDRTHVAKVVDPLWLIKKTALSCNANIFDETDADVAADGSNAHIKTVEPVDGMFYLVIGDQSGTNSEGKDNYKANVVFGVDGNYPCTRLYQAVNGTWKCIAKFTFMPTSDTAPVEDKEYFVLNGNEFEPYTGSTFPGDETVIYERAYPKVMDSVTETPTYGFAYVIMPANEAGAGTIGTSYAIYCSFLSLDDEGYINLTPLIQNEALTPEAREEELSGMWQDTVNKWPWDVAEWMVFTGVPAEDPVILEVDSEFVIGLDAARCAKYVRYMSGQVMLDDNGEPVANEDRRLQYYVNMLQMDAKLLQTTYPFDSEVYPLTSTLRAHFDALGAVKNRLFTGTRLYFEPSRSMGLAKFNTDGRSTIEHALDIRMKFRLHVGTNIDEDASLQDALKNSIIELIDNEMASGNVSMVNIANLIKENNSDSVKYVDVLGIDGDPDLQTLKCIDDSVRPHLKHELVLLDDKTTIELTRGLDLEFVVLDE